MLKQMVLLGALMVAGPAMATDEVTDPGMVKEFQTILFERGYKTGMPDGLIGPKTREAISRAQEQNDLPATGELSRSVYDMVMDWGLPKDYKYAAVAASTDAAWQAVWNAPTRVEAATRSLEQCRVRSKNPDKCAIVSSYIDPNDPDDSPVVLGALWCEGWQGSTRHQHIYVYASASRDAFISEAYSGARSDGYEAKLCKVLVMVTPTERIQ